VDHVSQDGRRAVAALPLHPDGPANFSKTGPIVYREGVHAVQARTTLALLAALGIQRAYWVGNSQGGQSAMVAAITYSERVSE
jgi:pimeloyl-ACP methyl ester carboxylesterase